MRPSILVPLVVLSLVGAPLAGASGEPSSAAVKPGGEEALTPEAFVARYERLYARRGTPEVERRLDAWVGAALAAHPEEFELVWRAAQFRYWESEAMTGERKKQHGKLVWELGDRAAKLNPKAPHGHYLGGLGVGAYSQAVGILSALTQGLEGRFNERVDKAIQIDPWLDRGGPLVTKGRYFYELPWPKRDLRRSAELLRRVIARHPENLRAHFYLGETLLADGKVAEANAALQAVLTGSEAYDPPEARKTKRDAQAFRKKVEERLR